MRALGLSDAEEPSISLAIFRSRLTIQRNRRFKCRAAAFVLFPARKTRFELHWLFQYYRYVRPLALVANLSSTSSRSGSFIPCKQCRRGRCWLV
jgi:hypothetical protein